MRRGAPPAGCTGWGSGAPSFRTPLFVPSLFAPLSFSILPACAALMLPLEHMHSHVFPCALTYPQSLKFNRHRSPSLTQTHPKIEKNENFRASGVQNRARRRVTVLYSLRRRPQRLRPHQHTRTHTHTSDGMPHSERHPSCPHPSPI